jgi:ElaB/YqjD/DUF883 family membrane-anchored ribosome-binding protein
MANQSSGPMTLEEIDNALADWDRKRTLASQNVLELMDHPTYNMLTGTSGFKAAKLTGITEARATPALKSLSELWGLFAELGKVLDQAHAKRATVKGLFKGDQLLEIEKLLTGPSVKVTVQVDFAQRSLLTPSDVSDGLTLERVMESMVKAYDDGKKLVLEIDEITTRLHQSLSASIDEIKTLKATAQDLGEGSLPELDVVDARVTELLNSIFSDPLGMQAGFDKQVEPLLKQARDRIGGLKDLFDQVTRDLAHAHETLANLTETQRKAKEALVERELKVYLEDAQTVARPPEDSTVTTLKEWLDRLDASMAAGKWKPLRMGVANWSIQATERLHASQTAYTANLAPLSKRQELRDFLDILKAKAEAFGRSEDVELAPLEKAARALLYTRPTRLAEADKLVQEYAGKLR